MGAKGHPTPPAIGTALAVGFAFLLLVENARALSAFDLLLL